ncbi:MAG: carbohydrate kinase [Gemmataceae bacterium]|nr:carbohydrate kinase [Gemmataceae bacterium]
MSVRAVGIGEVLWDLLPDGPQLGGAPANFAYHAAALGAEARVVSRVGRDDRGRELVRRLGELGVRTDAVEEDPAAPTGTVTVEVAADGQPRYVIHKGVAWDRLAGEEAGRRAVAAADVVCFGTLAQRAEPSRTAIRALLQHTRPDALRVFDVNLRQHYDTPELIAGSLAVANVLKVNEPELALLADLFGLPAGDRGRVAELARRFGLRAVAYTRGGQGSLLHSGGGWSDHPGVPTAVVDTVGAGDSFTAALALGLLFGWPLDLAHGRAAAVAAYVCSRPGGTPELPHELRAPFLAASAAG